MHRIQILKSLTSRIPERVHKKFRKFYGIFRFIIGRSNNVLFGSKDIHFLIEWHQFCLLGNNHSSRFTQHGYVRPRLSSSSSILSSHFQYRWVVNEYKYLSLTFHCPWSICALFVVCVVYLAGQRCLSHFSLTNVEPKSIRIHIYIRIIHVLCSMYIHVSCTCI